MPTYDYRCDACGHEFELFQSITAAPEKKCPACGKRKLRRLIGIGAAVLVGGGSSSRGSDEAESSSGSSSEEGAGASKSETTAKGDAKSTSPGDSSSDKTGKPDKTEKKISGSTSTPTHEAREGRGVGNLVDAVRRQRRESSKTGAGKTPAKKKAGTTKKASTTKKSSKPRKSKG